MYFRHGTSFVCTYLCVDVCGDQRSMSSVFLNHFSTLLVEAGSPSELEVHPVSQADQPAACRDLSPPPSHWDYCVRSSA